MGLFSLCLLAVGYMIYCPPFVTLSLSFTVPLSLCLSLFLTLLCHIHRVSGDEGIHEPGSGKMHEGCARVQSWWEMQGKRFQAMTYILVPSASTETTTNKLAAMNIFWAPSFRRSTDREFKCLGK